MKKIKQNGGVKIKPIAMLVTLVEHHQRWNMKVSTQASSLEALLSKDLIIPPSRYMFDDL
jgi:hypothetical protein